MKQKSQPVVFWFFVGLVGLGVGLVVWSLLPGFSDGGPLEPGQTAVSQANAAVTAPPLGEVPIPTRTPMEMGVADLTPPVTAAAATPTLMPTALASVTDLPEGTAIETAVPSETAVLPPLTSTFVPPQIDPIVPGYRERFGVSGGNEWLVAAVDAGLPVGVFMNWRVDPTHPLRAGVRFWHTVRLGPAGVRTPWADIDRVATTQPGAVWIIGNEPDVVVQDNLTPQQYARLYHQVTTTIKERDPTALLAIAGVAQPTPLRMAYLDAVLETYQAEFGTPMPIDIWTVHAFVLREEANSWGVGIPPGMSSAEARLYEIGDHANLEIIKQNLVDFRAWMAARGYQERPLAITEYGIVMPHDYGFPPELVAEFMVRSFAYFASAANDTGYPPDGSRLVQWWLWFSLYEAEEGYGTGNLVDATGLLTPLGRTFAGYVNQ